ncbi:uncharacterized protein Dwil_GK23007 [Drosophila willistoni]|uniref:Neuropeptide-like protein 31 n=1 Tax=Drosophila willistoni TaxID=7260 RepID=B4NMX1_DROWI|nr:uncharacterized protein Dwil_GK23007 [Drosophila willistoni]
MAKFWVILLAVIALTSAGPIEEKRLTADAEPTIDTADSIGYGYYAAPAPIAVVPSYYGRSSYGGWGGGYKYSGGYGYGRYYGGYYRRPIYPVWG